MANQSDYLMTGVWTGMKMKVAVWVWISKNVKISFPQKCLFIIETAPIKKLWWLDEYSGMENMESSRQWNGHWRRHYNDVSTEKKCETRDGFINKVTWQRNRKMPHICGKLTLKRWYYYYLNLMLLYITVSLLHMGKYFSLRIVKYDFTSRL